MARKVMVNGLDIGYIPPAYASDVIYNNLSSGLASTVSQGAIDELASRLNLATTATLTAGATTVSFSDARITANCIIDPYLWVPTDGTEVTIVGPTKCSQSTGQCTFTFEAQPVDLGVGIKIS